LPFSYPNALASNSKNAGWRIRYTSMRLAGNCRDGFPGRLPFERVEEPDALNHDPISIQTLPTSCGRMK
jgi:hypothetical protein